MKKVLVMLLAFCILTGLASCGKGEDSAMGETAPRQTSTVTAEETQEGVKETEPAQKAYEKAYGDLVSDFKKLLEFRVSAHYGDDWVKKIGSVGFSDSFKAIAASYPEEELEGRFSYVLADLVGGENDASGFGYVLYDLNKDSTPELFWVRGDHSIVAVFTYRNGEALLLDAFWSRYEGYVSEKGEVYGWGSGGEEDSRCSVYAINSDGLFDVSYGFSSERDILGGDLTKVNFFEYSSSDKQTVTRSRFEELSKKYPREQSKFWMDLSILPLN